MYVCILALDIDRFTKNPQNIKFHVNPSSGGQIVLCRQTDGQTCETNSCSFANAPKNKVNNIFFYSSKLYLPAQIFTRISEDISYLNDTSQTICCKTIWCCLYYLPVRQEYHTTHLNYYGIIF